MGPIDYLIDRLDRIWAKLAELKWRVILNMQTRPTRDEQAWSDFLDLSKEVSARWSGPGAVEEIRAQREK